ncbi:PAAR domain-containing protein [Luteibacter sp.]|jgi:uncharacterized Zn-binding protein involved in type VI secretion|uniref:PAAR domain-containing protein n=1 Tax=Luteibacter sp. TaxID=1886636 RepID=UPI002F422CC1
MSRRLIVVGDRHSHGGTLEHGCADAFIGGRAIVRQGDKAHCPLHGDTYVATASARVSYYGATGACEGDELACGARLIASQSLVSSST